MNKRNIINEYNNLRLYNKNDYTIFVDSHYEYLKNISPLDKDEMINLFIDDETHLVDTKDNIKHFFEIFSVTKKNTHHYYFIDRKQTKTIIFFPMPQIAFNANFKLLTNMAKRFSEYNILAVDNTSEFFSEHVIDKSKYRESLMSEINHTLEDLGWGSTKKYFNVICYGTLVLKDLLHENFLDYEKVIFFAPMVHYKDKSFKFINKLVDDDIINFPYVYYIGYISINSNIAPLLIPKKYEKLNLNNFDNFFKEYEAGIDLSKIKNKSGIFVNEDHLIPHENSGTSEFSDKEFIQGHHMSIFGEPDNYLNALSKLIN